MVSQKLTLIEALKGIKTDSAPPLLQALQKCGQTKNVYKLSYEYGTEIIKEGQLVWPSSAGNIPDDIRPPDNGSSAPYIPLGYILNGDAEVFKHLKGVVRIPMRHLKTGDFLGVFEVADYLLDRPELAPKWNISSGSICCNIMARLGDKKIVDNFKSRLDNKLPPYMTKDSKYFRNAFDEHFKIIQLAELCLSNSNGNEYNKHNAAGRNSKHKPWQTEIILFPHGWFSDKRVSKEITLPLLKISHEQSSLARRYLSDQDIRARLASNSWQYPEMTQHIYDVLSGYGYCFESAHTASEQYGPFVEAAKKLHEVSSGSLRVTKHSPVVFQPCTLGSLRQSGYIFLKNVWPHDRERKDKSTVQKMLDGLREGLEKCCEAVPDLNILFKNVSIVAFANSNPETVPDFYVGHGKDAPCVAKPNDSEHRREHDERVNDLFGKSNSSGADPWLTDYPLLKIVRYA